MSYPSPATPPDDGSPVTIRFATHRQDQADFEALALECSDLNPSTHADVVPFGQVTSDDYGVDTLEVVSAVDTAYQAIRREASLQGLYRDLTPFLEADASFEPDDFFPGLLEAFRWDGRTWALPSQVPLDLVFYNRRLFDEGGVPYPSPEWTRDDFLAAAQALTVRRGDDILQYGFLGQGATAFVLSTVIGLAEDQAVLDTPAVVDTVRWYTDLALVHGVTLSSCWEEIGSSGEAHNICWDKVHAEQVAKRSSARTICRLLSERGCCPPANPSSPGCGERLAWTRERLFSRQEPRR
jgi:ABC-type glycerol-3-phosphate transport system substrate-binding protein